MKIFLGGVIGFFVGFLVWFPYGIMYTVQSHSDSAIVKVISVLKGLFEI